MSQAKLPKSQVKSQVKSPCLAGSYGERGEKKPRDMVAGFSWTDHRIRTSSMIDRTASDQFVVTVLPLIIRRAERVKIKRRLARVMAT